MPLEIQNETGFELPEEIFQSLTQHILESLYVDPQTEVSLAIVDETEMSRLHMEWMDLEGPTDVMSFPMDEMLPGSAGSVTPAGTLGDIILCTAVAHKQAEDAGHGVLDEMRMLFTHGMLHLLGFDHAEPLEEEEMFTLQRDLLGSFYDQNL